MRNERHKVKKSELVKITQFLVSRTSFLVYGLSIHHIISFRLLCYLLPYKQLKTRSLILYAPGALLSSLHAF